MAGFIASVREQRQYVTEALHPEGELLLRPCFEIRISCLGNDFFILSCTISFLTVSLPTSLSSPRLQHQLSFCENCCILHVGIFFLCLIYLKLSLFLHSPLGSFLIDLILHSYINMPYCLLYRVKYIKVRGNNPRTWEMERGKEVQSQPGLYESLPQSTNEKKHTETSLWPISSRPRPFLTFFVSSLCFLRQGLPTES
jgi:hypothetical protein